MVWFRCQFTVGLLVNWSVWLRLGVPQFENYRFMCSFSLPNTGQLATKEVELESVRGQALNPQKLEVIKAEITKELEGPLKDHVDAMDKEVYIIKYTILFLNVPANLLSTVCQFLK